MAKSLSLRVSVIVSLLLVAAAFALVYLSRTVPIFGAKTADACVLGTQEEGEVYFVSCGGFF